MKKKLFSILLIASMALTILPVGAFATVDGEAVKISSMTETAEAVCENHKTHDDTCGFLAATEKTPCGHLKADGYYSCAPESAQQDYVCSHDDACGICTRRRTIVLHTSLRDL